MACWAACRAQNIVAQRGDQSQAPLVLSLTNVAVSKQKALLHATQATQVQPAGDSPAASRVRQHALQAVAQSRLGNDSQAEPSAAALVSNSWLLFQIFCAET